MSNSYTWSYESAAVNEQTIRNLIRIMENERIIQMYSAEEIQIITSAIKQHSLLKANVLLTEMKELEQTYNITK